MCGGTGWRGQASVNVNHMTSRITRCNARAHRPSRWDITGPLVTWAQASGVACIDLHIHTPLTLSIIQRTSHLTWYSTVRMHHCFRHFFPRRSITNFRTLFPNPPFLLETSFLSSMTSGWFLGPYASRFFPVWVSDKKYIYVYIHDAMRLCTRLTPAHLRTGSKTGFISLRIATILLQTNNDRSC